MSPLQLHKSHSYFIHTLLTILVISSLVLSDLSAFAAEPKPAITLEPVMLTAEPNAVQNARASIMPPLPDATQAETEENRAREAI